MAKVYPIWWDQQLFDDNGAPLAGGKVYSYYAGTNTPAPTFNDNDQPNSFPVIADMDGRIQFKLDPAITYTIVIKTAAGSTVKTRPYIVLPSGSGATGGAGTLQEAYDGGANIILEDFRPISIIGGSTGHSQIALTVTSSEDDGISVLPYVSTQIETQNAFLGSFLVSKIGDHNVVDGTLAASGVTFDNASRAAAVAGGTVEFTNAYSVGTVGSDSTELDTSTRGFVGGSSQVATVGTHAFAVLGSENAGLTGSSRVGVLAAAYPRISSSSNAAIIASDGTGPSDAQATKIYKGYSSAILASNGVDLSETANVASVASSETSVANNVSNTLVSGVRHVDLQYSSTTNVVAASGYSTNPITVADSRDSIIGASSHNSVNEGDNKIGVTSVNRALIAGLSSYQGNISLQNIQSSAILGMETYQADDDISIDGATRTLIGAGNSVSLSRISDSAILGNGSATIPGGGIGGVTGRNIYSALITGNRGSSIMDCSQATVSNISNASVSEAHNATVSNAQNFGVVGLNYGTVDAALQVTATNASYAHLNTSINSSITDSEFVVLSASSGSSILGDSERSAIIASENSSITGASALTAVLATGQFTADANVRTAVIATDMAYVGHAEDSCVIGGYQQTNDDLTRTTIIGPGNAVGFVTDSIFIGRNLGATGFSQSVVVGKGISPTIDGIVTIGSDSATQIVGPVLDEAGLNGAENQVLAADANGALKWMTPVGGAAGLTGPDGWFPIYADGSSAGVTGSTLRSTAGYLELTEQLGMRIKGITGVNSALEVEGRGASALMAIVGYTGSVLDAFVNTYAGIESAEQQLSASQTNGPTVKLRATKAASRGFQRYAGLELFRGSAVLADISLQAPDAGAPLLIRSTNDTILTAGGKFYYGDTGASDEVATLGDITAGATGIQGATGVQGIAGTNGATGIQGIAGSIGATGVQGIAGTNGATGIQGIAGSIGATGLAGTNGTQGVTGLVGSTGLIGPAGATGAAGTAANVGVETLNAAGCNTTLGGFDGTYGWIGVIIPSADTTINTLSVWCTQAGTGTYKLAIYSSALALLKETASITTATGLISGTLTSSQALTKNTVYYLGICGSVNGASFLGSSSMYTSNSPFVAKEDQNISTFPATFVGSSTGNRFWIGAYT